MTAKNDIIFQHLKNFASLNDNDVAVSAPFWKSRKMTKGDFFNMQQMVCNDLGLVVKGIFRIYYHNPDTEQDMNVYFFSENQFLVSFRSFISRNPCWYFIEAMEDQKYSLFLIRILMRFMKPIPIGVSLAGYWQSHSLISPKRVPRSLFSFRTKSAISGCLINIRILLSVSRLIIFHLISASQTPH